MKASKVFLFINIMKKLIVLNLKEFFEIGFNNQFKILSELEKQVVESLTGLLFSSVIGTCNLNIWFCLNVWLESAAVMQGIIIKLSNIIITK